MQLRATSLSAIKTGNRRRAWTPAVLGSALAMWLDASDSSTITLNGSTVSQWSDKSGRGNNASQGTASSQPTYTATGWVNNRPALLFDGSNDSFAVSTSGTLGINTSAGYFLGAVVNPLVITPQFVLSGATVERFETQVNSGAGLSYVRTIYGGSPFADAGTATIARLIAESQYDGTSTTSFWTGNAGTSVVDALGTTNTAMSIGFRPSPNSLFFNGHMAEIVLTNRALTTAERRQLEGYLAWKWGGL